MKLLTEFINAQEELFNYFGYEENWRAIPVDSAIEYYWHLTDTEEDGSVRFAKSVEVLLDTDSEKYYENEIYTQRHLSKWVYRGEEFTMIVVDTHTDGNKFLQIFANDKEINTNKGST